MFNKNWRKYRIYLQVNKIFFGANKLITAIYFLKIISPKCCHRDVEKCNCCLCNAEKYYFFYRKFVVSDKANFWLTGYMNKQNFPNFVRRAAEPVQKLPTHHEKISFWCGLLAVVIIELYFFKDDDDRNITVDVLSEIFFVRN